MFCTLHVAGNTTHGSGWFPPTSVGGIHGLFTLSLKRDVIQPAIASFLRSKLKLHRLKPNAIADRLQAAILEISRILMPEVSAG